jgi:sugar-specific transcriptional regulator TrmB
MTKHEKYFKKMLDDYSGLFDDFQKVHDAIAAGDEEKRDEFNQIGTKALRLIRKTENEVCSKTENSGYGKFSENLSEKFWEAVRGKFPLIDTVKPL